MSNLVLAVNNIDLPTTSPELIIVPTVARHIRELSRTIRELDRKEIESFGVSVDNGLWQSFRKGLMNQTAVIDGEVAAVWGCGGDYLGDQGSPWLLTSPAIHKISALRFARYYQREVHKMLDIFPYLFNYVDATYDEAVRLLMIVGFTLGEPEKIGLGMFRKFTLERGDL
jgi:hypothetical protein